jgi:hypothetical protein
MWRTHAPTSNKWHKKKKVTLHMLTHGAIQGCGLTSLVVCINDKICDIREKNVTIRSEIWTTNIRSLGFRDIREWVTLWRLILWSLGCITYNNIAFLSWLTCSEGWIFLCKDFGMKCKMGASLKTFRLILTSCMGEIHLPSKLNFLQSRSPSIMPKGGKNLIFSAWAIG